LLRESLERAAAAAESLRRQIRRLAIDHPDSPTDKVVTVSIGVASTLPDVHTTPQSLINLADEALYGAKAAGRDRVMLAQQD
jgi:diguanylate cyclase (GGDEF)-like protein